MTLPSPDVVLSNEELLAKIGQSLTAQRKAGTLTQQSFGKTIKNWLGVFYAEIHNYGGKDSSGEATSSGYAEQQWSLKATARLHNYFRAFADWETPTATAFDDLPENLEGVPLGEKISIFSEAFFKEGAKIATPNLATIQWLAKNAVWIGLGILVLVVLPYISGGAGIVAKTAKKVAS